MVKASELNISSILAPLGGFATVLYTYYYIQQLSLNLGIYYGVNGTIKAYNINASSKLLEALGQTSTLPVALHLSYVLVPFSLIIFSIGILWLFSKSYSKMMAATMAFASIVYLIIAAILQLDFFGFSNTLFILPGSYIGGILALAAAVYFMVKSGSNTHSKRSAQQITINPETPYSNMKILSNKLMKKLSGQIYILDMHFDVSALDNLIHLVDGNLDRYKSISVLAKADRLNAEFEKRYKDFKIELENKNVSFELRILSEKDASKQHERMIIDNSSAYKIPPLNIINRKSEHIVGIKHDEAMHRFSDMWSEATRFDNYISTKANPK